MKTKKIILIVLCAAIVLNVFAIPKKASAAPFTVTIVWDIPRITEHFLTTLLNKIAWMIAKLIVQNITQQIVHLIRTGGQGGAPLFVTNWQGFLLDAADQAGGKFLEELKLTQLCQPFASRLRVILGSGRRPFNERARCTISDVLRNVQNFYGDFSQGGWARWFEITQIPQNNFYGAYYLSLEENLIRQSAAVEARLNEAISANGFIGIEECVKKTIEIEQDELLSPEIGGEAITGEVEDCDIVSPGKFLENRLAEATNSDIEQLNLADSFNEILVAALQTLIQNIFFSPGGLHKANISNVSIQQDLAAIQADSLKATGIDKAIAITEIILNLKQNSLAKTKDAIVTLGQLKQCKQNKNEPVSDINNRIQTASSTQITLEGDIVTQTILRETLKDDRQGMLLAQTINDFQKAMSKTQEDTAKVGSPDDAKTENDKLAENKQKAEEDLAECKKPSSS